NNTLTGTITGQTGGTNITIQSDSGLLTLQNFTYAATGTRKLNLGGAGDILLNGTLTGPNSATPILQLVKYGAGTLTLGRPVTLTGTANTLDVQGGTMLVNSAFTTTGSPTIATTVQNTAKLGGSGTLIGPLTVKSGGILAPGNPGVIGTLTMGSAATFAAGSTLQFKLGANSQTGQSDRLALTAATVNFQTSGTAPTNVTVALAALGFTGAAGGAA